MEQILLERQIAAQILFLTFLQPLAVVVALTSLSAADRAGTALLADRAAEE